MDQHYHPLILQRLSSLFAARDWNSVQTYLSTLSHAHFRTAGYLMGERLMPELCREDFWEVMLRLVQWQPKAFVVTTAKAATPRLMQGTLSLTDTGFQRLATALQGQERWIDRKKLLLQWLPVTQEPATIETLFRLLQVNDIRQRVEFLLHTDSMAAAFVLLRSLRFEEHDREWLAQVCRALMKRGDNLAFNVASLIRTFFDLQEVKGVFSLNIQPFELTRLETDYESFKRIARKV